MINNNVYYILSYNENLVSSSERSIANSGITPILLLGPLFVSSQLLDLGLLFLDFAFEMREAFLGRMLLGEVPPGLRLQAFSALDHGFHAVVHEVLPKIRKVHELIAFLRAMIGTFVSLESFAVLRKVVQELVIGEFLECVFLLLFLISIDLLRFF